MKVLLEINGKKPQLINGKCKAVWLGYTSKKKYKVWFLNKDGSKSGIIDQR